ncbi:hypothetical protein G6L26_007585 [Agrobacterium radiobacter]|uniref:Uncharacterized protein n=1 Tax=Agrobacterium tumefaciens str. B6 TaxID=1183423 RepID=A0A822UZC1_AGRTU|nr:hypothetical protein [Agrobacterium tumefaciens]KWT88040.1 hypothetical protein ASB65_18585 [Agrobacterium tumefaciens str. B6]MQB28162.1 hypothetical protein [Agrobacterium tumefaciens]OCJ38401.1 hypothetical protein A6U90_22750 [Agrobacterium tumefaciens]CVI15320.1 hypothetical protein AGR4A_Cc190077 [Agrobacterium tumefaciens str. B6]SPZ35521.1 Uncharacterised protein [Agrobacterium tumefaciens]
MPPFSTTNTQESDDPTEIIIRLRNCEKQIDQSTREFRRDVNRLITGLLTLGIISASFLHFGMPADRKMAKANQEIDVAWKR